MALDRSSEAEIHVIGLGTHLRPLGQSAFIALEQSDLIFGAQRHRQAIEAQFPELSRRLTPIPSPFSDLEALIQTALQQDKRIVLLASGDPLLFGLGAWVRRTFAHAPTQIHSNLSSLQQAFARVGLPWQQATLLSLHGRPMRHLRAVLSNHRCYAVLTDEYNHPAAIAQTPVDTGYGDSKVHVLEALDEAGEQVSQYLATDLVEHPRDFHPLNVVIIESRGPGGVLPEFPGMDDEQLLPDAEGRRMYTKRQVRLAALNWLQSEAGQIGWDIGAGCGGLALEWARWHPQTRIHALEKNPMRLDCLTANRERFGDHGNLFPLEGDAPRDLTLLPDPDRIFVGGNAGQLPDILRTCWDRLNPKGVLVAVAVTQESRAELVRFAPDKALIDLQEISVASTTSAESVGGLEDHRLLRPQLPVLMLRLRKGSP